MNIKLLQWNINDKENPGNIVAELSKLNPDIFLAQELLQNNRNIEDWAKYIASKLNYEYYFHPAEAWTNREDRTSQGNAIFSRFKILSTSFSYLTPSFSNPPDANHEGRVYIEISCNINNKVYFFGTTQLSFSKELKIDKKRVNEMKNLLKVTTNHKSQYIFTGDLNALPDSIIVQGVEKQLENAGPEYDKLTWPSKPFNYKKNRLEFSVANLKYRVDYVFKTKDVKVLNAKIITTSYSDHLPILLTIAV